ncbi:uncharacterized protein LOC111330749 [Stylophora pistillata]|uniref:RING finger and CHY zinc finger domain-containing protein 1 n=1 Tax=Stylophora pistillata TaxID=50429 RepID=A0A2B4S5I3_STYPI|nr:uncharacterized protein LOC111330749 [Stylophora pistillata]XP_022791411.1 uncharacterized protein LOC111330749 [Stylophora pistillata]XP_022791412.1 uncharacterized protein LOC111330749 [Stylophora pistillata]XP_022791413.1 uncharacterized protein LOC111330749 [Stylophora pistillata]XP_022791414.1 uncharacterized protein LOC111330749 [Stylophora pistillata]XP_022791415.1 uncharacterized protein LOC111330749 [Stylophora pistillata]XP_022791416.1 uncharacterized protein LOC111330749 [Stylop
MVLPPEHLMYSSLVAIERHVEKILYFLWKNMDSTQIFKNFLLPINGNKVELCGGACQSCKELDSIDPYEAILEAEVDGCSLFERLVNLPLKGEFHENIKSPSGNSAETIALAVDQLRLLRNEIKSIKTEMIDKKNFDYFVKLTREALDALKQDTSAIDKVILLSEKDFPVDKVQPLQNSLETENCGAKQFEQIDHCSNEFKSEGDLSAPHSIDKEQLNKSLLSAVGSASSLNSCPSSPHEKPDSLPRVSPFASEEVSTELTENAYQEEYACSKPLFDSSARLQADCDGKSRNEEGLMLKDSLHDTETMALEDGVDQRDQECKQSKQFTCTCPFYQRREKELHDTKALYVEHLKQSQDEITFYQDLCRKQEEEIMQLKEYVTQIKEEIQGLQAEVGRQLFLEGKNKRYTKIYQPFSKHGGEQIKPSTVRGASFDLDGKEIDTAFPFDNSGLLLEYITEEVSELLSKSEVFRIKLLVGPKVDSDRLARIRKGSELFKELKYKGELSCFYVKCLLEKIHRYDLVEKLITHFHNSDELFTRECHSPQERNQGYEASERICGIDERTSNEVEKSGEISESADIDEKFHFGNPSGGNFCDSGDSPTSSPNPVNSNNSSSLVDINYADSSSGRCGLASSCSQCTSSSAVYVESLTEDSLCGAPTVSLNSDHHALKAWENSCDTTSGGEEKQERSVSLSLTDQSFASVEVKEWGAAKVEGGKEDLNSSSSICDGAVNGSYLVQHCNTVDIIDGPGCSSSRAQDSFKLKNVSGIGQDFLSSESMPKKQNVSHTMISSPKGAVHVLSDSCASNQFNTWEHVGARSKNATQMQSVSYTRITPQKDSAVDKADSYVSNQSHKWEHLGARPRDRTPKKDSTSDSSSLFSSLVDLVPQQVGEPVVQGVVNAFLARHSEDKHLHESLYYNNAEEMLAKDMDSMMNMIDPNKAKPYLCDCQVATRSDPFYQPYSSIFPLNSEAYTRVNDEDGLPLSGALNGDYLPPPGPSYSCIGANTSQNSYFNSFNPTVSGGDFSINTREPQLLQDGHFTSFQRSGFLQPGFAGSGLTSGFLGTTGPQMPHSNTQSTFGFTETTSEPLQMQRSSTTNLELLVTSPGNTQIYGNQQNVSSVARAEGSDSECSSGLESGRNTHLSAVSLIGNGVNSSGQRNLSSISNTVGNHLASGTFREVDRTSNSSSSGLTSGANAGGDHDQSFGQSGGSVPNGNYGTESVESTDNSLLELEQRVEEACAMVERVLREREEREEFGREIERKEREIRAERARKKREREARELEETRGWPQQQEPVTGQSLWLCEHYQRHCRVRFPCCTNFYSCHRCHNNSKECDNEEAKASHATHLKCNYCHHEQEIAEDSAKCRSCGAKMSAYFCGICKHFTSIDKNPYHCDKCGICRIHKDKSFHCDVCNVCLDKRLQGKHKCRPDSGHDECCICLEDAFSGCQILPCSHKVHRECAIAMIQNGIRTCPVCRHPLYSPAPG